MKKLFLRSIAVLLLFSAGACAGGPELTDTGRGVEWTLDGGTLALIPLRDNAIRVRFTQPESVLPEELIYTESVDPPRYRVRKQGTEVTLSLSGISAVFDRRDSTLTFLDAENRVILREKAGGRSLENATVQGEPTFAVEQRFVSPPDEYLYGTGQFQDGYLNVRGLSRRLTQVNTQIAIPFVLSNKGYGLLWNNYGLTDFNPADNRLELLPTNDAGETVTVDATGTSGNTRETRHIDAFTATVDLPSDGSYALLLDVGQRMARKHYLSIDGQNIVDVNNIWLPPTTSVIVELTAGKHEIRVEGERNDRPVLYWRSVGDETVFRSPVAQALDYTVFAGTADEVIAGYRQLTGPSPLLPLWAYGYIHCRERYNTQPELLENAREFRERQLPMDVIVQDWQYWGKHGWNAMRFDEERYPDPAEMVRELHAMNIRLMISVWSKIDRQSEVGQAMAERGYYIPESDWIDFFNPDAAAFYWQNFSERLLKPYRIDAWWQDATEPENDDLQARRIGKNQVPGEIYRNVYPLFVNKTVYEGLRRDDPERRSMILTRSGFSGIQRYATVTWSGDVGHDWETLRRQIAGGLGQMATGLPWWTYDAGGFFRPGDQHTNPEYHEQLIRWVQASVFFPLMRVHGYMSHTEPWRYGAEVEDVLAQSLELRYRLLPYIYSGAARVSMDGYTLMRPLVMDFPDDRQALEQRHQFMFGPALLVAPVTEGGADRWPVYLPENPAGWLDFRNGQHHAGGRTLDVPIDRTTIPLFVRAGSIVPLGPVRQYAAQPTDEPLEIRIYPGADASFVLYADEGVNYSYEKGEYATVELHWNDAEQKLTLGRRHGSYPGMETVANFRIVRMSAGEPAVEGRLIRYDGTAVEVAF